MCFIFSHIKRPPSSSAHHLGLVHEYIVALHHPLYSRAGPRIPECGGHRSRWYDVSGVNREGGEYERGRPPLI